MRKRDFGGVHDVIGRTSKCGMSFRGVGFEPLDIFGLGFKVFPCHCDWFLLAFPALVENETGFCVVFQYML